MALNTGQVSVGTSSGLLVPENFNRSKVLLKVVSNDAIVFIGDSSVTPSNGFPLATPVGIPTEITIKTTAALYAVTLTGTVTVYYMEVDGNPKGGSSILTYTFTSIDPLATLAPSPTRKQIFIQYNYGDTDDIYIGGDGVGVSSQDVGFVRIEDFRFITGGYHNGRLALITNGEITTLQTVDENVSVLEVFD